MDKLLVDPEIVIPSLALIIPGFVWLECELRIAPRPHLDSVRRYLTLLLYSVVNYAIWYPILIPKLIAEIRVEEVSFSAWLYLVLILLISPAFIGVVLGLMRRWRFAGKVLKCLSIPSTGPGQTGWDYAFDRKDGCLVCVFLRTGGVVYGLYGVRSLVSAEPTERDIYLERTFYEDSNGSLVLDEESCGVWLPADSISQVQLYDLERIADAQQKQQSVQDSVSIVETKPARLKDDEDGRFDASTRVGVVARSPTDNGT